MKAHPAASRIGARLRKGQYLMGACGALFALTLASGLALGIGENAAWRGSAAPAALPTSLLAISRTAPGAVQGPWRSPVADIVRWSAVAGDAAASAGQQPWRSPVADLVKSH